MKSCIDRWDHDAFVCASESYGVNRAPQRVFLAQYSYLRRNTCILWWLQGRAMEELKLKEALSSLPWQSMAEGLIDWLDRTRVWFSNSHARDHLQIDSIHQRAGPYWINSSTSQLRAHHSASPSPERLANDHVLNHPRCFQQVTLGSPGHIRMIATF